MIYNVVRGRRLASISPICDVLAAVTRSLTATFGLMSKTVAVEDGRSLQVLGRPRRRE